MKLSLSIGAVAMSTCTMLAASAPAWDHVVMSPQEVVAGDYGRSPSPCPARRRWPPPRSGWRRQSWPPGSTRPRFTSE